MKRLLVVEHDQDQARELRELLQQQFEVVLARDGFEALLMLETERFHVVLELSVPLADGESVVATLRDRGIVPPILLGSAAPELPEVSARLGLPHLSKPYAPEALLAKLRALAPL